LPPDSSENKIDNSSPSKAGFAKLKADRNSLFWGFGLFAAITVILTAVIIFLLADRELYYPYRLSATLSLVKQFYPEASDDRKMLGLARDAVISQLDRFSGYLDRGELDRAMEEFSGSYGGIGITVVGHKLGLQVMSVREDGPAAKAGIKTGDIIIKAGGVNMEGMNPYRATNYLRGLEASIVEVVVLRNDLGDMLTFKLTREKLKLIHVSYAGITVKKSLYIRLLDFEAGAADEVSAALDSLYFNRKDSLRGIILDLRGNPGGLLYEAISLSDLFIGKGHLIVGIKGHSCWSQSEFYSSPSKAGFTNNEDITHGLPLAIIVDRGSASASEIFAGAMKYAGRGILIGDTTFGKGLVQELDRLYDGSGLRITTARYYFEGNRFLNDPNSPILDSAAGIAPDYFIEFPENEPFPLSLENSLLLRDFALSRKDDASLDSEASAIPSKWFGDFEFFARQKGYKYKSSLTEEIIYTMDESVFEKDSESILEAIKHLYHLSLSEDSAQFVEYRDYILRRLFQYALEAKFGTGLSYRQAILPYRQDIALAEKIFQDRIENK